MNKLLMGLLLVLSFLAHAVAANSVTKDDRVILPSDCVDDVLNMIRCPLDEDVSMDDAVDSMKLRANMLNFKLVAHMPLSAQVKLMGGDSKRIEIFQFCDAVIAAKMVEQSIAFAGLLPCRIAMVEDAKGQAWLITVNIDSIIQSAAFPPDFQAMGMTVRNKIFSILKAGAQGDL